MSMKPEQRRDLIRKYKGGYQVVADSLDGIQDDELDRSASDEWTPRQIDHHLADSEITSAIRLRQLLAEDDPQIAGYDEAQYAQRLTRERASQPDMEPLA